MAQQPLGSRCGFATSIYPQLVNNLEANSLNNLWVICGTPVEPICQSHIVESGACDISQKHFRPLDSIQKATEIYNYVSECKLTYGKYSLKIFLKGAVAFLATAPNPTELCGFICWGESRCTGPTRLGAPKHSRVWYGPT